MSENTLSTQDAMDAQITLGQIRGKALAIRDEVKEQIAEQAAERHNQLVAIGVATLVVVVGVAYLVGSRAGKRAAGPRPR